MGVAGLPDDRVTVIMRTGYLFGRRKANFLFSESCSENVAWAWELRELTFRGQREERVCNLILRDGILLRKAIAGDSKTHAID